MMGPQCFGAIVAGEYIRRPAYEKNRPAGLGRSEPVHRLATTARGDLARQLSIMRAQKSNTRISLVTGLSVDQGAV
jgi:hypothetical protein